MLAAALLLLSCRGEPNATRGEPTAALVEGTTSATASASAVAEAPKPWLKAVKRTFDVRMGEGTMGELTVEWEPLDTGHFRLTTRSAIAVKVALNGGAVSRSEHRDVEEYGHDLALLSSKETELENTVEEREELSIADGYLQAKVEKPSHRDEKKLKLPADWSNELLAFAALRNEAIAGQPLPRERRFGSFDSDSMTFQTDTLRLVEKIRFETPEGPVDAWKVEDVDGRSGDVMKGVLDDAGLPLRAEFGAFAFVLRGTAGGTADMATVDSAVPIEGGFPISAASLSVDVTVKGDAATELALFVDSPYQTVKRHGDVYSLTLHPRRRKSEGAATVLPMKDLPPDVAKYLDPTAASQSDDPTIQSRAKEIVGSEKDSARAARTIVQWAYRNLQKREGARGAATAVETLASGGGDCTEHTALTVALARAAGIPARAAGGVVLIPGDKAQGGYHAWPELWVGEWVAMDPALGFLDVGPGYLWLGYDEPGEPGRGGKLARLIGRTSIAIK